MSFFNRKESSRLKKMPPITWPVEREKGLKPGDFSQHNREDSDVTHTSYSSARSPSTGQTSLQSIDSWSQLRSIDIDEQLNQFRDDLDISDECPTKETLKRAGEVPIYDADGNSMPFKNL
ncbi:hypothetical protein LTS18_000134, partial [Coniosporium uncinatum]